jgi:hypothetical protein
MEPDADPPPPAADMGGNYIPPPAVEGHLPKNALPSNAAPGSVHSRQSTHTASRHRSHLSDSIHNNPPSQQSPLTNNIILRISPASGSATFGYIYLAETELHHKDAITAYFDSGGWVVTVFPCPDFETYIADNSLMYRNVMFITNLPRYVIPAGIRILEANWYNDSPHYDWLPAPPDLSSFNLSSHSVGTSQALSQHSRSLLSRQDSYVGYHPDPEGIDPHSSHHYNPRAPIPAIFMGGNPAGPSGSHGGMSPLTHRGSGSTGGGASVAGSRSLGGVSQAQLDVLSISTTRSPDPIFIPLAQPNVSSAISVLGESSSDPTVPDPTSSAPPPAVVTIKDKASDLGLKDITDKDSWINAKKIIDARLHRPPYCPGPDSKILLTTKDNLITSAWWEEVINYYVKPPISDLFVEESQFDGKGFEMIEHIDKYFNPSGTVDSLSHIFDLIDIKQAQAESVIMLKARFSRVFARLKMGGVAIDSALQVGFMLRALRTTYQGIVPDFRLGRHSLASATLQSVVKQCMSYDKDPWKGPVGKDGKPARTPSANAASASGNKSNPYEVMASCLFGNHMSCW